MSSDEKQSKLRRRILAFLRDLLLWAVLLLQMITDHPMRPLQPWNFYLRLIITAFVVSFVLVGIVNSFRSERKWSSTSGVFFLIVWLLAVIGAFWYGPLLALGLLLMLASRIPAVVSYFRSVFANLAKSYREMSKEI